MRSHEGAHTTCEPAMDTSSSNRLKNRASIGHGSSATEDSSFWVFMLQSRDEQGLQISPLKADGSVCLDDFQTTCVVTSKVRGKH